MSISTTLTHNRQAPGVYVTEFSAFPPSIVGVATAVPIFIGYTETASDPSSGKSLYLQPVALDSMADYVSRFGQGFAGGLIETGTESDHAIQANSTVIAPDGAQQSSMNYFVVGTSHKLSTAAESSGSSANEKPIRRFNLYSAMQMFFANGGGNCFVVSVGNYWGAQSAGATPDSDRASVKKSDLLDGLKIAKAIKGGTMLVVPDACLLTAVTDGMYADYQAVAVEMLNQAGELQDRVAILDMPGALEASNWTPEAMQAEADAFYAAISPASDAFSYGAAYGPALQSSLLSSSDLLYNSLSGTDDSIKVINNLLTSQALSLYPPVTYDDGTSSHALKFQDAAAHIAAAYPVAGAMSLGKPEGVVGSVKAGTSTLLVSIPNASCAVPVDASGMQALDQYLTNAVPLLSRIKQALADQLNVVPPSGAIAGIWAGNDVERGVWNAPANVSLNQVLAPKVILNDEQQGGYNVPLNGNAINILRAMVNRGTVVWGARTLDGNSLDYRYIQVRRTLNYIEQSIKNALQQFTFAANDSSTWETVTATISNFLTQLWQSGGLMGDKASDAFSANCGVPTTMTGLDVLNGYMIVNVMVQLIHPAEFIELTFKQTMQGV